MAESARLKKLGGVVRAGEIYQGKQGLNYTPGISAQNVGSQAIWLGSVTLPPHGGPRPISTKTTKPHSTSSAVMRQNCGWGSS